MTKKVLRIRKYKSVLWNKYHNSGSYNDLCEYKRVLNRATSEYKKLSLALKKKLAGNVKTDPKSFYAYVRSKSKTKTSVGPLKNGDGVLVSDDLEMSEILNSYFGSVFTKENLSDNLPEVE